MTPPHPPLLRAGLLATAIGIVLGLIGPFGSYLNGPLPERVLFWIASMWSGSLFYGAAIALVSRLRMGPLAYWPALLVGAFLASIPQTLLTRTLALRLWPALHAILPQPLLWFAQTNVLGTVFAIAAGLWWLRRQRQGHAPAAMAIAAPARQLRDVQGIIALQIEDHYVRVHRVGGSQLVLMPLRDAIGAVNGIEGLQTHRSWWVAKSAIAEVQGTPRAMQLRLSNGLQVPVARSAVTRLRECGWLESPVFDSA